MTVASSSIESAKSLVIELPIPMPTWNRILGMGIWERKKLRDLIHEYVSRSLTTESDSSIQMDSPSKRLSMELFDLTYLQTIRPSKSRKSDIAKLKAQLKELSSKSKR